MHVAHGEVQDEHPPATLARKNPDEQAQVFPVEIGSVSTQVRQYVVLVLQVRQGTVQVEQPPATLARKEPVEHVQVFDAVAGRYRSNSGNTYLDECCARDEAQAYADSLAVEGMSKELSARHEDGRPVGVENFGMVRAMLGKVFCSGLETLLKKAIAADYAEYRPLRYYLQDKGGRQPSLKDLSGDWPQPLCGCRGSQCDCYGQPDNGA